MDLEQGNALGFLERASNAKDSIDSFLEGAGDSVKAIGDLCSLILKSVDYIVTIITNPIIILTAINKLSMVVIIVLLSLKILGFENLEKWIWLTIVIKIVSIIFM
ncbi:MAG: hypothetical protein ACRCX2_35945 [Paraclostridium sp.]